MILEILIKSEYRNFPAEGGVETGNQDADEEVDGDGHIEEPDVGDLELQIFLVGHAECGH